MTSIPVTGRDLELRWGHGFVLIALTVFLPSVIPRLGGGWVPLAPTLNWPLHTCNKIFIMSALGVATDTKKTMGLGNF